MLLRKTLSLNDVSLKMIGDAGQFSGYASAFGGVDSYGDTIAPGAFHDTLKDHAPKMFFNHDWNMPVGKWTLAKEDAKGLYVEGELTPGLSLSTDVHAAMKHGTLDGLSIGGFIRKGDYTETDTGRLITKWSDLVEVSPVVFPADASARIDPASVKASLGDLEQEIAAVSTVREFEFLLRDAGGFSKRAATALVARVKAILAGDPHEDAETRAAIDEVLQRISKITA